MIANKNNLRFQPCSFDDLSERKLSMKKLLSVLLSMALLCGFALPAFAASEADTETDPMNEKYCSAVYEQIASSAVKTSAVKTSADRAGTTISSGMYLYSFNENPVAIFYKLAPQGYAVLDYTNGVVLEYSTEADNPFFVDENAHYYYNGIFDYCAGTENGQFINLATGQIVQRDDCLINKAADFYCDGEIPVVTKGEGSEGPVCLENPTRHYNCNVVENFSYFYPNFTERRQKSVPGVCGSVACATVVAYLDDYNLNSRNLYSIRPVRPVSFRMN